MLGGNNSTGVGWAAGIERIVLNLVSKNKEKFTISVFSNSPEFNFEVLNLIKSLKPKDNLQINFLNSGNFKKNFQKQVNLSLLLVLFLQRKNGKKKLIWKDLISDSQETFSLDMIEEFLNHKLEKNEFQTKLFFFKAKTNYSSSYKCIWKSFWRFKECKYCYYK